MRHTSRLYGTHQNVRRLKFSTGGVGDWVHISADRLALGSSYKLAWDMYVSKLNTKGSRRRAVHPHKVVVKRAYNTRGFRVLPDRCEVCGQGSRQVPGHLNCTGGGKDRNGVSFYGAYGCVRLVELLGDAVEARKLVLAGVALEAQRALSTGVETGASYWVSPVTGSVLPIRVELRSCLDCGRQYEARRFNHRGKLYPVKLCPQCFDKAAQRALASVGVSTAGSIR